MKKFILGLIVGVSVTAAGSAYADDIVMVGKTIQGQFPVKISGSQLDTQAIVVDGTSYLPVRSIGEALNMDVKFDAELGIELNAKGVQSSMESTLTPEDQENINSTEAQYPQLTAKIEEASQRIVKYNQEKSELQAKESSETDPSQKKLYSQQIASIQENIRVAQEIVDELTKAIESMKQYVIKIKSK
ncbi:hypothetical protein [Paenibacillus sp. LjRoot56]|uniref:hypothetical protein n=1 Tax=Paenibacillus sp. LjRoot56 TaxID=3342333 RepID=UPI003ECC7FF5